MRVRENNEKNTVDFGELKPGDCFRFEGDLCVKSTHQQNATGLESGDHFYDMCGILVTPVNAEVHIID